MTAEQEVIEKVIFSYGEAMNKSDITKLLTLFTEDGIIMPPNATVVKGQEQLKGTYEFLFKTFQLQVEFFIVEVVVTNSYAIAQTTSKGTSLIKATGQTVPVENKELFILENVNATWKIFKYMFNQTK